MYAGRNNIYEATIRRMIREGLEAKTSAFLQEHHDDTQEELLNYVRKCAAELGHTPHAREILGGEYICLRFGSWANVLSEAGLPAPCTPDKISRFALYQAEREEQQRRWQERKAEGKRL